MRRRLIVTILAASVIVGAVPASGLATVRLKATLTGKAAVPRGAKLGRGTIRVAVSGQRVCWILATRRIQKPLAIHIHKAIPGTFGPVVVVLRPAKPRGCTTAPRGTTRAIARAPKSFYVDVHTARWPLGAIRGQLRRR
jgi:CHRD domain